MASERMDIFGSLLLNADQEAFRLKAVELFEKGTKSRHPIVRDGHSVPAQEYSDYVVTIRMSRDGRDCEIYRNRNGKLLFARYDGKNASVSWEYIFVQLHIDRKLKELDG